LNQKVHAAESEDQLLLVGLVIELITGHHNYKKYQAYIIKAGYPGSEIPYMRKLV
jgi:hypothetical protein